jgi:hypothetical protein
MPRSRKQFVKRTDGQGVDPRVPWQHQPRPEVQKARQREAARQIRDGKIVVLLTCGHCGGSSLHDDVRTETYRCLSCAQLTSSQTAHAIRRQRIREIIQRGVDLPGQG